MSFGRELRSAAAARGIRLSPEAVAGMEAHHRLLRRWNRTVRLTSLTDAREILDRHFLESLEALRFLRSDAGKLVDVGTGNGFPALPLLMARPRLEGILLEPTTRKRAFLKEVLREVGLSCRVKVLPNRIDAAADLEPLSPFDYLTVRAVGGLAGILDGAAAGLAPRGRAIVFVGRDGLEIAKRSSLRLESHLRLPARTASYLAVLHKPGSDPICAPGDS